MQLHFVDKGQISTLYLRGTFNKQASIKYPDCKLYGAEIEKAVREIYG